MAMRDRVARLAESLEPARPRPRLRYRHRPGLRDARTDRLRGAVRLRGDRQRDQPGGTAVRRRQPWQILTTERVYSAAGEAVVGDDAGQRRLRGFNRDFRAFSVKGVANARGVT